MAKKFVLTAELQFRKSTDVDRFVSDLKRKFSDVNVNVKTGGTSQAISEIKKVKSAIDSTNHSTEELAKTFALSFKRFVSFSIATRAVAIFTSRLNAAFRKAREFEAEMIKISQVTGKSMSQLSDLTNEINRLATTFGVYGNTLSKVSVLLSQAGFNARDTKIALDALAKTELAPTFDNIIETTEGAIALFNQFGQGADALAKQLGAINRVAGAFAVESGDLIEVVRRVGGVFRSSGGDLNELLSLFTSVRQTTRENAESIATALRTIFVRIQRPKTIEYLRKYGIELTDELGRFVGPLEAIEEIYRKFGSLPQGDLRLIEAGEVVAGFRQIGKFIPLIQQYRITQEALNVAKAGENSLDQDAIKAKEGLANKLSRLNEEFQVLIRSITESKTFKIVTNFFIDTTSAVIKLVDALKPLIPLFTVFAGVRLAKVIGGFSKDFGKNLISPQQFNTGGSVPGYGNTDTVPAMLTPGEFVLNKKAAKTIGSNKLNDINKSPQRLNKGGWVVDPGTIGIFTLDANRKGNTNLGKNFQTLKATDKEDRSQTIASGFPIKVFSISNNAVSKSRDTINEFDEVSSKYLKEIMTETISRSSLIAGIDPLEIDESIKSNIINKFSKDTNIKSTLEGFMLEGLTSALTGVEFEGGTSNFDFDFLGKQNKVNKQNFEKLFGEEIFPGLKLGDAKRSLDIGKVREKIEGFIKAKNSYTEAIDGGYKNSELEKYGFKYIAEGLSTGKNIGKSINQENVEEYMKKFKSTKFFDTKGNAFIIDGKKIGIRIMTEFVKAAYGLESDSIPNKNKLYGILGGSPDENKEQYDAGLKRIREIFREVGLEEIKNEGKKKKVTTDRSSLSEYASSKTGAIGYLDTDLMRQLGDPTAHKTRASIMMDAIEKGLKITNIIGMAGAGKTTMAHEIAGGSQNLYPVTNLSDLDGLSSLINVSSEVTKNQLEYLSKLREQDKVIMLSSSTEEEMNQVRANKSSRDASGKFLFGRKAGSTKGASEDSRVSEALIQKYVKAQTEFRSVIGNRLKDKSEYVDYEFLGDGRMGAQVLGSFNPTTIGHVEGLTRDLLKKGAAVEDILIRVSKGEIPNINDESTWRTAIFGQKYREFLAKVGFGDAGFTNVQTGNYTPELGFIDQTSGKVKIFDIALGGQSTKGKSIVGTGGKTEEGKSEKSREMAERYGMDYHDAKRSSFSGEQISGTLVREYLKSGKIEELKPFLTESVYKSILENRNALQARSLSIQHTIGEAIGIIKERGLKKKDLPDIIEEIFNQNESTRLKFAGGGPVPGTGNRDTVPAMLTPGEYVLNKGAVAALGMSTLDKLNKGKKGGKRADGVSYYGFMDNVPGGGLGAFAGLSILGSLFTQLVGESSQLGQAFGVLQKGATNAAGSYFLMSQVVDRTAKLMADEEGNINKGFLDLFPKFNNKNTNEFDNKIKELTESFKGLDQAVKDAEAELEAAKLIKDPSQIEEKTNALNEAKRKRAVGVVISDPKKLKERIGKGKSAIEKVKSRIGNIDEEIAKKKDTLKLDQVNKNPVFRNRFINDIKNLENQKSRAKTGLSSLEQRVSQDESLLNLNPKSFSDKLKGLKPDFSTASGRARIGGGIAAAGALATTGLDYWADSQQQRAEKAFSKGQFTNARSNLTASKDFADASSIASTASQFASAGAAFGPVGVALGAVGGALWSLKDVVADHTEKMQAIDFKIIEESFASLDVSMKQYQEGLIGLADLYNEERDAERNKSQNKSAGRIVGEARRRKLGALGSFGDKVLEFSGDSGILNNQYFQKAANSSGFQSVVGLAELGKERNKKYDDFTLTSAILDKDLTVEERSGLITQQQQERTKNLDRLKLVASDTNLNQQEKVDKVTLEGNKLVKSADTDLVEASKKRLQIESQLLMANELKNDTLVKELTLQLDVVKGQERAAKTQKSLALATMEQVKSQEALIRVNLNKIKTDSAASSAMLEFDRILEESRSGINVFARSIQEAEFAKTGTGRTSQLKEANQASISALSGLVNEDTRLYLQTQSNRQVQGLEALDKLRSGEFKFDPSDPATFGQQVSDQLQGVDPLVASKISEVLQTTGNTLGGNATPEQIAAALNGPEIQKLSEEFAAMFDPKLIATMSEYNTKLINLGKERIAVERNYISEISNAINLRKEAEQIQGEFGGKAFTPARERELELQRLNQGLASTGAGNLTSLSGDNLLAAVGKLDIRSGQNRTQVGGGEEQRERLKTQQEALINAARANIEIRKKEIEIIKQKNRLEQDAIKSLAQGDIEGFFNNIQSSAATDALAAGDDSILRQLGPRAIAGAVENLQSMAGAGITEFNGRSVNELVRQGNMAMATSTLGANSSVAQSVANQNTQISTAESDIRKSAEVLGTIGDQQYGDANIEFMHSTQTFDKAVSEFKVAISKIQVDVTKEKRDIGMAMATAPLVFASGGSVFKPRGSDTVPAMLTPGEFVVRRSAVNKIGVSTLNRINKGYYNKGGVVGGGSEVYNQAGFEQFNVAVQMFKESVSIFKDAISIGSDVKALSDEISKLRESFMDFANTNMSVQLNPTSVQVNISDLTNSMRKELSESAQNAIIDRVVEELKRGRY